MTSSNPPLTKRTVRDEGELLPLTIRKNLLLNSPVYRAVFHLVRDNLLLRQRSLGLPHLGNREIAHAYVPYYSVANKPLHCLHRLGKRNTRIGPVKLVEIH